MIWIFSKESRKAAREAAEKKRRERELFDVAHTFNRMHTYAGGLGVRGRWMCPDCNKVHDQIGFSFFTGRLFPRCCRFDEGERIYDHHATKGARERL